MVLSQVRTIPSFTGKSRCPKLTFLISRTTGDKAAEVFQPANLPNEKLGHIWALVDREQRGVLELYEFIVAMHLVVSCWKGLLPDLPPSLPPSIFEAAARSPSRSVSTDSRPAFLPPPGAPRPQSPMVSQQQFASLSPQSTGTSNTARPQLGPLPSNTSNPAPSVDWLITANEKSRYDTVFSTVDRDNTGVIVGDQAVEFFSKTGLSEDILAQIWDLADIDSDGQLTRDEFAVAMHLIKQRRAYPRHPLPATLPFALVPPNMRQPPPVAAPPRVPSATDDLLGLDSFGPGPTANAPTSDATSTTKSSAPAPTAAPHTKDPADALFGPTSDAIPSSFPTSSAPVSQPALSSSVTGNSSTPTTSFKPFVPTSSFGQSLAPQFSGSGSQSGVKEAPRSKPQDADDLLNDVDPEESKKISPETADLANLSNQVGSLTTEMRSFQEKRVDKDKELSQTSAQKQDFENRLAQARIMYEHEVANFKTLEERLKTSRADTEAKQKEYLVLESQRADLQTQTSNYVTALEADTAENTSLKERIKAVNAEIAHLKPQLEKLKAEAKQQKGFAAINQKQLGTVETERDQLQGEVDSTKKDIDELHISTQPQEQVQPPPPSNPSQSPIPTASPLPNASSWNPFFRKINNESSQTTQSPTSAAAGPNTNAPSNSLQQQSLFDVFGPKSPTPPPRAPSFHTASASPTPRVATPPSAHSTTPAQVSRQSSIKPTAENSSNISPPAGAQPPPAAGVAQSSPGHAPASPTPEIYAPNPISTVNISQSPKSLTPGQSPAPASQDKKDPSFDSFFDASGLSRHERSPSNSTDAREAFASMSTEKTGNEGAPSGFELGGHQPPLSAKGSATHLEFPPIQELSDHDDDNSSDEEPHKTKPLETPPRGNSDDLFPPPPPSQQQQQFSEKEKIEEKPTENKSTENKPAEYDPVKSSLNKIDDDFDKAFVNLHLSTPKEVGDSSDTSEEDDPFSKGGSNLDLSFDPAIAKAASATQEKHDDREEHK